MEKDSSLKDILPCHLTENQKKAITHEGGHLLITAGPGAGKTDTIVRRVVYQVRQENISPERIVVITFTNKAAEELYNRLRGLLGNRAGALHISTIHSFCNHLLRRYPGYHPWGAGFDILDAREQFLFVYARLKDLGLGRFPKKQLGDFIFDVIAFFNLCTEEQVDSEKLRQAVAEEGASLLNLKKESPEAVEEYTSVIEAYRRYRELLEKEGLIDYSTLQEALYRMLLDYPEIKEEISSGCSHFLVDEYQDTNRLQVEILRLLSGAGSQVVAVGDEDQSIYRFRGATVKSFLRFKEDFPGAEQVDLDKNFRATGELVKASSKLIAQNEKVRTAKQLSSARSDDNSVKPLVVDTKTCPEEATRVANLLRQWKESGVIKSYNQVALLFRSVKYHAGEYLSALESEGIPFYVRSDGGFFDREDIIQLKELIKFCGWKQKWDIKCLQGKMVELSPQTVKAVLKHKLDPQRWTEEEILDEIGITDEQDRQVMKGIADLRERTTGGELNNLMELFYELLQKSGYFTRCCSSSQRSAPEEEEAALLNLAQFSQLLEAFQRHVRTKNTYRFGEYLRNIPARSLDSLRPEPEDAVQIMTVHQAKGLEFPLVVIGSAMEGRFPQKFRPKKYPLPGKFRLSKEEESEEEHFYDQRRLFYVAMTRAEDSLVVGAPAKVNKRGGGPSRFVQEMGADNVVYDSSGSDGVKDVEIGARDSDKPKPTPIKRISYTALHSYLLCPLQYKILYECDFAVSMVDYFRFGGILHRCLEQIHRRAALGEEVTPGLAEKIFNDHWQPGRGMDPERAARQKDLGVRYLRQYVENYAANFQRIYWVEEPVELPLENYICSGRVDLALKGNTGIEVIDFKVRTRKGLDAIKPEYQLEAYGLAASRFREERVEKVTVHLLAEDAGQEQKVYTWSREKEEETRERLEKAVQGIEKGFFEANPNGHCKYCDFERLCPASSGGASEGKEEGEVAEWVQPTMGMDP